MNRNRTGGIEFEKLAMIVIVLAVLLVVLVFFRYGFGGIGEDIGTVGSGVSEHKNETTTGIGEAFEGVGEQWAKCKTLTILSEDPCKVSVIGCSERKLLTPGANLFCDGECTVTWTDAIVAPATEGNGACPESELTVAQT